MKLVVNEILLVLIVELEEIYLLVLLPELRNKMRRRERTQNRDKLRLPFGIPIRGYPKDKPDGS